LAFDIRKKAVEGAALVTLSYGISQAIRLGGNLVLTRLLVPELFGIMAIVQVFILGLGLFSDIGVGPSLIQNKRREDPDFYNTAWTIQAIRGVFLWLGSVAIAYPVSLFYENEQLLYLFPILGGIAIIEGFNSTSLHLLNQRLEIRRLIFLDLTAQTIGLVVMIVWAYLDRSVWALVSGGIVSALLRAALSHMLLPGHLNRFRWDPSASKELFRFGRWIFVSTATMYLAAQADRMILGKLFSFGLLGVYTIAITLAEFPKQVIITLSGKIIFPLATHYAVRPRIEFKKMVLEKRRPLLFAFAACIALMACSGDWIIRFLYDERYIDASFMLPFLALGTWPLLLYSTQDACLLALGKAHYKAMGNGTLFLYMLAAIPVAYRIAGIPGAILAVCLKELPAYLCVAWGSRKEGIFSFKQDCFATIFLLALVTAFTSLRYWLHEVPAYLQFFSNGLVIGQF